MISAEAFLRRNPVASQDMPIAEQRVQSKPPGRFSRRGRDAAVVEDPNDLVACREAALRLLDAAPRASGALRERLLAKGYGEAIVDEVIERLIRVQLIDDSAYAESAVRYCAGRMMGRRGAVLINSTGRGELIGARDNNARGDRAVQRNARGLHRGHREGGSRCCQSHLKSGLHNEKNYSVIDRGENSNLGNRQAKFFSSC